MAKDPTNDAPAIEGIPATNPKAARVRPAPHPCLCGCGSETRATFAPGHDAKVKSLIVKEQARALKADEEPNIKAVLPPAVLERLPTLFKGKYAEFAS